MVVSTKTASRFVQMADETARMAVLAMAVNTVAVDGRDAA